MTDDQTTVAELRQVVRQFVDERDWQQFHSPKNLSMALAIEVSELMEHFQWIGTDASWKVVDEPDRREDVRDEMADVLCYLLALANEMDIDLTAALRDKMVKNAKKYPAEEYRGRYGPEDDGSG
jgi:NTP pyrophosphatase (non-canonical NTP hydrolase)